MLGPPGALYGSIEAFLQPQTAKVFFVTLGKCKASASLSSTRSLMAFSVLSQGNPGTFGEGRASELPLCSGHPGPRPRLFSRLGTSLHRALRRIFSRGWCTPPLPIFYAKPKVSPETKPFFLCSSSPRAQDQLRPSLVRFSAQPCPLSSPLV